MKYAPPKWHGYVERSGISDNNTVNKRAHNPM